MMKRIFLALLLLLALSVSASAIVGCQNTGEQGGTIQLDENGEPQKNP